MGTFLTSLDNSGAFGLTGTSPGAMFAALLPNNRRVGRFPIPGQLFAWLGKVTKADGTSILPQRSSATPDWWKP